MGYWGTVVVARPDGLLVDQDDVGGFGYRHRWLRELSDGWQLLETSGWNDPPDLLAPAGALATSTGRPVFAAYVSDGDCAVMATATPDEVGPLTHLWDTDRPCGVYRHQPRGLPEPVGRTADEVIAELMAWSAAAGLRADATRLRAVLGHEHPVEADDLLFALVKALGVARIGRTRPWTVPLEQHPFASVTDILASRARAEAAYRQAAVEDGAEPDEPEAPWEAAAIRLEEELWASLYRPEVDVAGLARRAQRLRAEYDVARGRRPRPPHGPLSREHPWNSGRVWADRRATD
ncbi:hypothetical protein [Micromonospora sp. HK10]|uniref:hypothetical protein n=1 Tax=Micromonospora sp. HK10 TaxID=1538294 RepID=UPI0006273A8F|nr:hypothetical protein [Micromonospora sp. HK10]KKK07711.1 hypothetical protein LQ51_01030 [Micromonospora sp. HK10]